jgi:ABC-type multidrug transport system permease subunit
MEVRIVMRFFFPYTPWAGILRKVPFPPTVTTLFPLFPFFSFFFFFSLLQAAKLNYVRFENLRCAFFTLVSSLLRLIAGLYNTCFSRAPQRLSILNSL